MKNSWIIVAILAILVLLAGCQGNLDSLKELQMPGDDNYNVWVSSYGDSHESILYYNLLKFKQETAKQMGQVVEWSKTVDDRLNTIANATDPNSLISQLNGEFARHQNNLRYLYRQVLDPNDPNSLASRVEVLEENDIHLSRAVGLSLELSRMLKNEAKPYTGCLIHDISKEDLKMETADASPDIIICNDCNRAFSGSVHVCQTEPKQPEVVAEIPKASLTGREVWFNWYGSIKHGVVVLTDFDFDKELGHNVLMFSVLVDDGKIHRDVYYTYSFEPLTDENDPNKVKFTP